MTLKQVVFSSAFLFIGCSNQAEFKVPKVVQKNFETMYPGEEDPNWQLDKNGNYEAKFKKGGIHYRADYTPKGMWVETEQNIKKKALPKAIKKRLKKDFEYEKIYEIEKVSHHQKGLFYDVELKIEGKKKDIEFLTDGTVIN